MDPPPIIDADEEEEHRRHYEAGNTSSSSSSSPSSASLIRNLYIAHFFARWDARMWEFSVGLYMIHLWPDSLILAAVYGAVESASTAIFGPLVGQWIERLTYVQILRLWLFTQNLSFIVAGTTVVVLLLNSALNSTAFILLVTLANLSGAVGVLSTLAGTILIEREWVVVISEGHPPNTLTSMNSTIRRIDLSCKLLAPVVSGFIISFVSIQASAMTLACWNTIAVWLEYGLFMSVYKGIPALRESNQKRVSRYSQTDNDAEEPLISRESMSSSAAASAVSPTDEWLSNAPFFGAWSVYLRQNVVLPGVALALLYFTVLSFGTLMTATLEWEGIPAYIIGLARGVSAIIGISATFIYPVMQSQLSTLRTGLWSIWSQDHVPESDRCVVGGVQNSLQSALDLLGYIMGIIISNPEDFWKLNLISVIAVTLAAVLYSVHIYRVRNHLIHFEKLAMLARWAMRLGNA
ncbi:Solute carrier family 40 member 1 [Linum perenne]